MRLSADSPEAVLQQYEATKRAHLQTAEICRAAGVRFTLPVLEAHGGGMSGAFRGFAAWLAAGVAATKGSSPAGESLRIAQRISVTLQRENARAVLRRLGEPVDSAAASPWADVQGWEASGVEG